MKRMNKQLILKSGILDKGIVILRDVSINFFFSSHLILLHTDFNIYLFFIIIVTNIDVDLAYCVKLHSWRKLSTASAHILKTMH